MGAVAAAAAFDLLRNFVAAVSLIPCPAFDQGASAIDLDPLVWVHDAANAAMQYKFIVITTNRFKGLVKVMLRCDSNAFRVFN